MVIGYNLMIVIFNLKSGADFNEKITMRDYEDIVQRIEALKGDFMRSRVLAEVDGYPLYHISLARDPGRPAILLMGGVHGDEPAGVEAVLRLMQRGLDDWLEAFCFEVLPCFNPYGYVYDKRHNRRDPDLNWVYERDDLAEIRALRKLIDGRRFEGVIDFHEDWESPGYYLYELCRGTMAVGAEVVRRVGAVCPLNTAAVIEGQRAENGLVFPDIEMERQMRESREASCTHCSTYGQHTVPPTDTNDSS